MMDYAEKIPVEKISFTTFLAKFSFFMYLFFVIFGTSVPFREKVTSVEDIAVSNPINHFVFTPIYIIAFLSLITKRQQIVELIKKEKFLSLFMLWSFLSVFWSDVPFVSFKRWVQFFGGFVVIFAVLINFRSVDNVLEYFKTILIIYIPLSFLAILFIPEAIQWEFPAWRGLASHKNGLGQISLMSLIIWTIALTKPAAKNRIFAFIFCCLSLVLLIGSQSTTAILTGMLMIIILAFINFQKAVLETVIGNFLSLLFFFLFWVCLFAILLVNPDLIAAIFSIFGKDTTLTGRTDLWADIFSHTKNYLFAGCGYGGFWIVDRPVIQDLYLEYTWFPNSSHLGYLDLLNETGIVGLLLVVLMICFYFMNNLKLVEPNLWKWLLLTVLILNVSESTLTVQNSLTGVIFIFSYLALYVALFKKDINDHGPGFDMA
jgi:exopolysaccharide production protein ExoQ